LGDRRRDPGLKRLFLTLAAALLLLPGSAFASTSQESLFQDDSALLFSTYQRREQTLDELKALGVDTIRSNVLWDWVAPRPNSKRRPARIEYDWFRWDQLVQGAEARGIAVQLTLTGPIPAWASDCRQLRHTCRPDPREFGRFVTAAAKHYPQVSRWSIWNEPNQAGWLYPQPEAPRLYRRLAYAAIAALRSHGHARDTILLGETAPLGRRFGPPEKLSKAPLAFWREVLCLRPFRCGRFKQLRVTGVAHHPYTRGGSGSPSSLVGPDDVTLASLGRLERVIDRAARLGRVPSRLPIYLTEYGFQTNPPDRYSAVSPSMAAVWLNQSDWIAYNDPRVRSVAQYELRDERPLGVFQTGLRFRDGRAKPGLAAYRLPLWVTSRPGRTTIWGQVRAGGVGSRVDILLQPRRGRPFRRFKSVAIGNQQGYFTLRTSRHAYRWRLAWHVGRHKLLSRASLPGAG
jgi:Cellulase (glycosyl hydrolase family 5)